MIDKEQHIKSRGLTCPFCGSGSIEGGFVEIDSGKASQGITCGLCGNRWQDVYELVDMVPVQREQEEMEMKQLAAGYMDSERVCEARRDRSFCKRCIFFQELR